MKTILATESIKIPEGVEVEINARQIKVTGPRGSLSRNFKHVNMALAKVGDDKIRVDIWFATRSQIACVRTICSHIENLFTGVLKGFCYKMRFVYSHFPINVTLNGSTIEIRNFLGEKRVRKVDLMYGVEYTRTSDVKDQIELTGNDIASVSLTAAKIILVTPTKYKDIRKLLNSNYLS